MSGQNLIPNGSFEAGLDLWEATPGGVTLVQAPTKRFVLISAGTRSAAICSEPISVTPGGRYVVQLERALKGDCDVSVIGVNSIARPDMSGEVTATEPTVRVQVTARPGHKVGLAAVGMYEIGPRARFESLRSTSLLKEPKEPFEIVATICNTGSHPLLPGLIRLLAPRHALLEDAKQEQRTPPIPVGEFIDIEWSIASQRGPLANYTVEFEYEGGLLRASGQTLRHRPHLPSPVPVESVASGRRWFSVASRAIRLTAHDTDLDYGPCLLSTANGGELGVLRHLAVLVAPTGEERPLYAKVKKVGPDGVLLAGKSEMAEWEILVSPDHASKGIAISPKLFPKRRLSGYEFAIAPFQTASHLVQRGSAVEVGEKSRMRLQWNLAGSEVNVLEHSRILNAATRPSVLLPGSIVKAKLVIAPAIATITLR